MNLYYVYFTLVISLAFDSNEAAVWSPGTSNDTVVYKCKGSDVTFPWTYVLSPGETIEYIRWLYNDNSMAVVIGETFLPTDNFRGRVQRVPNSGSLLLKNITMQDNGNYSMHIKVQGSSDNSFLLKNMLTLDVADSLRTTDQQIHAARSPSLVHDYKSGQWSLELVCGSFIFPQTPPFDVTWMSPSGHPLSSTGYRDGMFSLLLDSSLEGGQYTCRLSDQAPDSCASKTMESTVNVEPIPSRLSMMEHQVADQQHTIEDQRKQVKDQQETNGDQQEQLKDLKETIEDQQEQLDSQHQALEDIQKDLQGPCASGITTLDDLWRSVDNPQRNSSNDKCDRSLSRGWYRFKLQGKNAAIPTRCMQKYSCGTTSPMWLDLGGYRIPAVWKEIEVQACSNYAGNCCKEKYPVTVKNCSTFLIYNLNRQKPGCDLAYCSERS